MPEIRITKAVQKAILQRWPLYWLWYQNDIWAARTVRSGYALYAETGHHENGARITRRLWVHPDRKRAEQMNQLIIEMSGQWELKKNLEEVIFGQLRG